MKLAAKYPEVHLLQSKDWMQQHKGDPGIDFKAMIVPENHEKARALMKRRITPQFPVMTKSTAANPPEY